MKVRLYTAAQEFVHEAEIPRFNKAPEVVLWGTRVFRHSNQCSVDEHEYTEAWTYAIVNYGSDAPGGPQPERAAP